MGTVEAVQENAVAAVSVPAAHHHHRHRSVPAQASAPQPAVATPPPPPKPDQKPAHDVVAGAMARVASQGTIHPLDTMKVRMQTGAAASTAARARAPRGLGRGLREVGALYKGVFGAATGAGVIIGAYFAFYSTTKKFLRARTDMSDGTVAFTAGAAAALGSSVVKVPLAVCIRSVQAGVYPNAFVAAREIVRVAGARGLFTGFLPTLLEDVPDMAVKFAVYETVRNLHARVRGREASTVEDLVIGGLAGAAAVAATTPLDVVKTVMMTTASSRPTVLSATKAVMRDGGLRGLFRGVGPRALSNGLNSAVFFCFFEAIRQLLLKRQAQAAALRAERAGAGAPLEKVSATASGKWTARWAAPKRRQKGAAAAPAACLTLALPICER